MSLHRHHHPHWQRSTGCGEKVEGFYFFLIFYSTSLLLYSITIATIITLYVRMYDSVCI